MRPRRPLLAFAAAFLWVLLFAVLPWQASFEGWPWARACFAMLLFGVPGFCLHALLDDERRLDPLVRIPAALCLSVGLTGVLGFAGSVLRLPAAVVPVGLLSTGAAGIVVLVLQGGLRATSPAQPLRDRDRLLDGALLLFAVALAARLCLAPGLSSDDLTHVARIAAFQQREQLGFQGIAFGGENVIAPRYWLAFWPLAAALLSTLSAIEPLELTTNYLGAILGAVACLAVHNLARSLGASRRLGVCAALGQVGGLLLASARDQPGVLFFNRVTEDKFFAFFVLAPIVTQLVLTYLDRPTRAKLARVALAWLALTLSHPTSLGMVALVVVAFCALELLLARRREALVVLAVIVPLTGAAALVRFVPHVYHQRVFFDVETAREEKEITAGRKRRLTQIRGTPFYGIGPGSAGTTARAIGCAVLLLALVRARRRRDARYVLAALTVVGAAVVPYTGWILGRLVTPFHLWRILSLVPYGIGTAFVLGCVRNLPVMRRWRTPIAGRTAVVGGAVLLSAIVIQMGERPATRLAALQLRPDWQHTLVVPPDLELPYGDVVELGRALRTAVGDGGIVLASRSLNDLIPSLAPNASLLTFRSPMQTTLHAGIPADEVRRRWRDHGRVVDGTASPAAAARVLAAERVTLVLARVDETWLERIPNDVLPRTRLARVGAVEIYRLDANERPI